MSKIFLKKGTNRPRDDFCIAQESFFIGPLIKTIIFDENNEVAFNMITLMRADAREYYLGEIIYINI